MRRKPPCCCGLLFLSFLPIIHPSFQASSSDSLPEMCTGNSIQPKATLTPPLSLESGSYVQFKVPNLLQRVLSLLKNVRPGSDLSLFQLPPSFNLPKSQLQCFGESVYSVGDDVLSKCTDGKSPLERFAAVVGWSISTTRPLIFGLAPFNPILGETHHVSWETLNVMVEQVSHQPPVTALYATDEKKKVETIWCHSTIPKFYGTSIEAVVHGKRKLKLLSHGENYVMNQPNLLIRLLPVPNADWVGNVTIRCEETGLEAELCYSGHSFLGFGGNNKSIKGKIFEASSSKPLFEIEGHWDRTVLMKDATDGKTTVIYDAQKTISKLKTPVVRDPKVIDLVPQFGKWLHHMQLLPHFLRIYISEGLCSNESAVVWGEVSEGIMRKEWEKARHAKQAVQEKERELERERRHRGETWVPKHFTLSYTEDNGWECTPKHTPVPPAPIVAPS